MAGKGKSGGSYRSAKSGRYVTKSYGTSRPRTTVKERLDRWKLSQRDQRAVCHREARQGKSQDDPQGKVIGSARRRSRNSEADHHPLRRDLESVR